MAEKAVAGRRQSEKERDRTPSDQTERGGGGGGGEGGDEEDGSSSSSFEHGRRGFHAL
jgi:hypothetical protein